MARSETPNHCAVYDTLYVHVRAFDSCGSNVEPAIGFCEQDGGVI